MLRLRVVRGPLREDQNSTILREYNRLTSSDIAENHYGRWVRESPDGPVFHGLLETEQGEIAGHMCLIPLRIKRYGRKQIAAKAEYFFVRESFRTERIAGLENSFKPAAVLLLDALYRHCREQGWGPVIISAPPRIHPLHVLAGCRPVDFSLQECLFIFRPRAAAVHTPNLSNKQRAGMFVAGAAQASYWAARRIFLKTSTRVHKAPVHGGETEGNRELLALFPDQESIAWRFPEPEYVRFVHDAGGELVAKRGAAKAYLRVSQWHLESSATAKELLQRLLEEAAAEGAVGVRWAVYGNGKAREELVRQMKSRGFLCVPRIRRLLFHTDDKTLLAQQVWNLSDSLFNFDL
jgi:hypothetical protein